MGERTGTREGEEGREREEEGARIYANVAVMRAGVKRCYRRVGLRLHPDQPTSWQAIRWIRHFFFSLFLHFFFSDALSRDFLPPLKKKKKG